MNKAKLTVRALALVLALCMAAPQRMLAATAAPELPNPGSVAGLSKEQQIQVGRQAMGEVYQQMPVLPDSNPVAQYIQQLGKKLVSVIPQEYSWPYEFHVIPQKEINAFAIPGGPMFINVGTITSADNEAELVGVMAHEMSHIYMQHSAKQMTKGALAQGIAGVLGGLLGGGKLGTLAQLGINIGGGLVMLKYSRGDEAQADAVGAIIMYKAGYNPQAMADFFQKLAQQGRGGPQFLSDHPNPGNRRAAITKEIQQWPPKNYQTSSQTFANAKQKAAGVKSYTAQEIAAGAKQGTWARQNKESGATPKNLPAPASGSGSGAGGDTANVTFEQVKPSENFKQLEHSAFTIGYPDNWQVFGDPNSSVTIAPQAGVSQSAIAYGVVVDVAQNTSGSLDQATKEVIQNIQQGNPGMKVSGDIKSIQVNGREGKSVELTGTSPVTKNGQPLPERDWLVTVPRPEGGLLYQVYIAPENAFGKLKPTYQKMLQALQVK
jgi:beta-barrel assembly-enhancing protease